MELPIGQKPKTRNYETPDQGIPHLLVRRRVSLRHGEPHRSCPACCTEIVAAQRSQVGLLQAAAQPANKLRRTGTLETYLLLLLAKVTGV